MDAQRNNRRPRLPRLPPLILDWRSAALSQRPVRTRARMAALPFGTTAPPHLATGSLHQPFHFCNAIRALCADIAGRCPDFKHIDASRILFAFTQAHNGRGHGLQARVTPMRFRDGSLTRRHRGVEYQVQRYRLDGREILYIMTFCLPRFLNLDFDEKIITLFHEIYHISPAFDGDLRRLGGRYCVHGHSQKTYDLEMGQLARSYLAGGAEPRWHDFLRLNFAQLLDRHGSIIGFRVPRPKLIPVVRSRAAIEYKDSTQRE
jgi:hypothetical protein